MKVVVLGASGNAGTALLRALEAEPRVEEVVAVARRPPTAGPPPKTTWRSLDVVADPLEPVARRRRRGRAPGVADPARRAIARRPARSTSAGRAA